MYLKVNCRDITENSCGAAKLIVPAMKDRDASCGVLKYDESEL